ncbi:MAG: PPC domain-containing protein [Planctomycetes bacterium]|nr:PPC domain-containing protein [Planctomycetota bacterium]
MNHCLRRARLIACLLIPAWAALCSLAAAQAPTVNQLWPRAVRPGGTHELVFLGANLAKPTRWWTNGPLRFEPAEAGADKQNSAERTGVRVVVTDEAMPGVYAVRMATVQGLSNLQLIVVDDLPTLAAGNSHQAPDRALPVEAPVAVEGLCAAGQYEYVKFHAQAGQRLSFDVFARRLGSPLDPVLRLLDATGRELAYADDDEVAGADSRLTYRFEREGDYLLELRDVRYQGSDRHFYRLRIGDFPLPAAVYPLGIPAGAASSVTGVARDGSMLPAVAVAAQPRDATQVNVPLRYTAGGAASWAGVVVGSRQEQIEWEPNDEVATAAPLTIGGAMNGRFDRAGDKDYFTFTAKKGEKVRFTGATRRLGAPTDLYLRLLDAQGKQLAESDDSGSEEGVLEYTPAADGPYILQVEELLGRGGPGFVYRIEAALAEPGFTLVVDADKLDVPQGGVFKVKVTAVRRDFTQPITLALEGISGATLSGETIATGKLITTLTGTLPASYTPGTLLSMRVVGEGTDGKKKFRAVASNLPELRKSLSGLPWPPASLDGLTLVSVGAPMVDFFKLAASKPVVVFPQYAGKATLTVKVERLNKFDGPVTLAFPNLPAGFAAGKAVTIDKGKNELAVELTGPATASVREQELQVVGSGEFQNQPRSATLSGVKLRVAPPIEIDPAQATVSVPSGGKLLLTLTLVRNIDAKTPVELSVAGLPAGVTLAAPLKLEGDKPVAKAELLAQASAARGSATALLRATTTIEGRKVTFDVGTIALDVMAPANDKPANNKPAAETPVAQTQP